MDPAALVVEGGVLVRRLRATGEWPIMITIDSVTPTWRGTSTTRIAPACRSRLRSRTAQDGQRRPERRVILALMIDPVASKAVAISVPLIRSG